MIIRTVLLILHFLLCTGILSNAPSKWSAGYRTGLELVNLQIGTSDFESENYIWHNQLFLARRLGKKFVLEAALFYTNKNYFSTHTSSGFFMDPDSFVNDVTQTKLGLQITGKYPVFIKPRWTLYGQMGFTFTRISDQYANVAYKQGTPQRSYNETRNELSLFDLAFGGLALDYNLSKRLYLTSNLNVYYKVNGLSATGNAYYNNWTANVLIGAGLKI